MYLPPMKVLETVRARLTTARLVIPLMFVAVLGALACARVSDQADARPAVLR